MDKPDWKFGTVLRNSGCDFVVMFLSRLSDGNLLRYFDAVVLRDGITAFSRTGQVLVCAGLPSDEDGWIVLDD